MIPAECFVCGCTEISPCGGGCGWALPRLCSRCLPELDPNLTITITLHAALCLAFRQPDLPGALTRQVLEGVLQGIEGDLVEAGLVSEDQIASIRLAELEAQPRIILARG